jgi:hypothetical protein
VPGQRRDVRRVGEESSTLDQKPSFHRNPYVERREAHDGECPAEVAVDAFLKEPLHLFRVPRKLVGERLDGRRRKADRLRQLHEMAFGFLSHVPPRCEPRSFSSMKLDG